MKGIFLTIGIVAGSIAAIVPSVSAQIPLRTGSYHLPTYNYIKIFGSKGNFCYFGTSKHGTTISSLRRDSKKSNIYKVYKFGDTSIVQKSPQVLSFGGSEYTFEGEYKNSELSAKEKACLKAKGNYSNSSKINVWGRDATNQY
jgi:hypothetical protein